jgi:RimJ/RimL family protein N-acetyltransferase
MSQQPNLHWREIMNKIYLKSPTINELHYRQEWMNDPKTMSYNAGYDMNFKGYNKETGTITKSEEEMLEWFNNWMNKEPDKYFAYIYDYEIKEPIGEVYYYLDGKLHSMGILIQDKYRGKGYSYRALLELEKVAFDKNNIRELSDMIPLDRIGAIKVFKKAGFVHTDLEQKELVFGKESIARQLLITRKMYLRQ